MCQQAPGCVLRCEQFAETAQELTQGSTGSALRRLDANAKTIRVGGDPPSPMASTPRERMGPAFKEPRRRCA